MIFLCSGTCSQLTVQDVMKIYNIYIDLEVFQ
jgi:hypothetical protein